MNPVVLVTGASSGIGAEVIKLFASHGYDVVLNYRKNIERAKNVAEEIERLFSRKVLMVQADISVEEEVCSMMDRIRETFGRMDVVVNNAGIAMDSVFQDKTVDSFCRTLDVNLVGTFLVSKYAKELMNKGSIVNVSSTNGVNSYYSYSMEYDASKAGVNLLTKDLAIEFAPDIRVNAVAPGWVQTEMNAELEEYFVEKEKEKIVLNRFADPMEIAKVIYFLASDDASYVNGSVVVVDGGRK